MGALFSSVQQILCEFISLLQELLSTHKCTYKDCSCECYSDEQQFLRWKQKSELPTYSEEVMASGVIGNPVTCDICEHDRSYHGTLKRKILGVDMLPNGGIVYAEMKIKEDFANRKRRSDRLNGMSMDTSNTSKSNEDIQGQQELQDDELVIQDETNLQQEEQVQQRRVTNGDRIKIRYKVFEGQTIDVKSSSSIPFNSTDKDKDNNSITITVGARDVVTGLDCGLVGATIGNRRRIAVPSKLAYGKNDMVFIVDVINFLSN